MTSRALNNLKNHEAIETTAAAWLARQDNVQGWTATDEQELQAWLDHHLAHRVAWLRLKSAWARADALSESDELRPNREADAERKVPWVAERRPPPGRFLASALVGIVAAGLLVAGALNFEPGAGEKYATAVGARQGVTLADGSRVMLNTRTRARVSITRNERNFWLDDGEAFFDIQHDAGRPFVIVAGNDRITVLGTKFSVRHEGDRTQVLVVEGRVKFEPGAVSRPASAEAVTPVLTANDTAVADSGSVVTATRTARETERDLSWRSGRLEFDNRPLPEIAAQFNRYNRRQLVVDEDAAGLVLTGRFDMYNVDGFVRSIQAGFGVVAHSEGDQMRLSLK